MVQWIESPRCNSASTRGRPYNMQSVINHIEKDFTQKEETLRPTHKEQRMNLSLISYKNTNFSEIEGIIIQ